MVDISGFGLAVTLKADNASGNGTFPQGLQLTQFADDGDSLDMPNLEIAQAAMSMNGDLVTWSHAVAIPLTINIVPSSVDDDNLQILANNNRVGKNKLGSNDTITLSVILPNGKKYTLGGGKLTSAPVGPSVTAGGRQKSKSYSFMFQSIST